jgi:4-hydroxy-tetrahydrodipicolinate synthase
MDEGAVSLTSGIFASTVCPMSPDGSIDVASLSAHLQRVSSAPGLRGLLINGHAGENAMLSAAECRQVVEVARECRGTLLVAGVNAESSASAALLAGEAAAAGADAIMVFAPFSWILGADPRAIVQHHRAIHDACDLPVFLFQGSVNSGRLAYSPEVLPELLKLPRVVGIKEGSWETAAYERTRQLSKRVRPEVAVMASGDEHLFPCFMIGSEGSLVSLAAVIPEAIVDLEAAVSRNDIAAARALNDIISPLARVIYRPPGGMVSARLKACLKLLNRIPHATCRAPVPEPDAAEYRELANALARAGLRPD